MFSLTKLMRSEMSIILNIIGENKKLSTVSFIVITVSCEEHKSFLADIIN